MRHNKNLLYVGAGFFVFGLSAIIATATRYGLFKEAKDLADTLRDSGCAKTLITEIQDSIGSLENSWVAGASVAGVAAAASIILGIIIALKRIDNNLTINSLLAKVGVITGVTIAATSTLVTAMQNFVYRGQIDRALLKLADNLCNADEVYHVTRATRSAADGNNLIMAAGVPFAFLGLCMLLKFIYNFTRTPIRSTGETQSLFNSANENESDDGNHTKSDNSSSETMDF